MLYLEDYLELIEHLPLELRDRFTDIRERDLQVHNSSEQLRDKVRNFFAEAKKLNPEQEQCEYKKLIKEYQETIKYADDKVHIAKQMHDIMVKLVQRLDTELEKFKLELEADHAGITEELEKRSLELDADSRLDQLIHSHLNESTVSSSSAATAKNVPSTSHGHKDRRRSEFKQQRQHPYQNNNNNNNNHTNGYHHHHAQSSKSSEHRTSSKYLNHDPNHHHRNHGSKSAHNHPANSCRQQVTSPTNQLHNNNNNHHPNYSAQYFSNSFTAPASVDLNGSANEPTSKTQYHNNLTSVSYSFKDSDKPQLYNQGTNNTPFNQQHSALSAALSSNSPQLNSSSARAMINSTPIQQQQNKISNNLKSVNDIFEPNCPLVRQNPLVAAASQAIAATQQLQQGRRTPSLKASFAAINAAGLGTDPLNSGKHDTLMGNNRNALAPMAPDHQAFRYTNPMSKLNGIPNKNPLYVSVTKSGRPSKRPKHHASHLYTDESPTSVSSDNSVFENSESLSSADFIETGTTFDSASPSSVDFSTSAARGNTTLYHRDETKYCVCRQISYGEMVACDNDDCEIEWFHYDCVGVTSPPKGKWFCPDCTRKMNDHSQPQNVSQTQKKRGRKEKTILNVVNNPLDAVRSK